MVKFIETLPSSKRVPDFISRVFFFLKKNQNPFFPLLELYQSTLALCHCPKYAIIESLDITLPLDVIVCIHGLLSCDGQVTYPVCNLLLIRQGKKYVKNFPVNLPNENNLTFVQNCVILMLWIKRYNDLTIPGQFGWRDDTGNRGSSE